MNKSILRKLKLWDFLGAFAGIVVFYAGISRISMGVSSIRISDYYTSHFMNVGVMYVYISVLILIAFTIKITYSMSKR